MAEKYNLKAVICVETGKIYASQSAASRDTGVSQSSISKACKGILKTAGGYHWKLFYVDLTELVEKEN